jgi:uncharacterized protein YciI
MWYLTLHRYVKPREESRSVLDEHLEWNFHQQQAGRILFSGPTSDKQMGIMVLKANSIDEAKALIDTEPFVREGYRACEIYEWEIHQILGAGGFTPRSIQALNEDTARFTQEEK